MDLNYVPINLKTANKKYCKSLPIKGGGNFYQW